MEDPLGYGNDRSDIWESLEISLDDVPRNRDFRASIPVLSRNDKSYLVNNIPPTFLVVEDSGSRRGMLARAAQAWTFTRRRLRRSLRIRSISDAQNNYRVPEP